jgi:hypothetical protein
VFISVIRLFESGTVEFYGLIADIHYGKIRLENPVSDPVFQSIIKVVRLQYKREEWLLIHDVPFCWKVLHTSAFSSAASAV